ncbi:sulfite oxidase [Roseomonas sp. OT10]|uniref:sulfite oxidase n=1 Tax=Roseomonas cutis TaxID=2897332 RepID=UPI001E337C91|nr:sulfite oxidase [Roseomonas sp. OT10]UFN49688.1 sulfite oxidase [Roseomonas sp. OT10]
MTYSDHLRRDLPAIGPGGGPLAWTRGEEPFAAALAAMGAPPDTPIPFLDRLPPGLPLAAALRPPAGAEGPALRRGGKAPLRLLQAAPLVAETPETLLDDEVTPVGHVFVRNNGREPPPCPDPSAWTLRLDGAVSRPLELTVAELERRFRPVTLRLQLECGGNGRSGFVPATHGNPWGNGAVSQCEWTGYRLRDLIRAAEPRADARFTGHFGADADPATGRQAISRGMPLAKALEPHTLLAVRMNGQPLPPVHGHPLRLVVPGWPGSLSQKWLTRITLRPDPHDGPGMGGTAYRVPVRPIEPGSAPDGHDFVELTSMPVRAVLTNLPHGARLPAGLRRLELRGHAWAGDEAVRAVAVSVDFGATWQEMAVASPINRYAWQRWAGAVTLPGAGYVEVWTRATDTSGRTQPLRAENWNPQGYGGNAIIRTAILLG